MFKLHCKQRIEQPPFIEAGPLALILAGACCVAPVLPPIFIHVNWLDTPSSCYRIAVFVPHTQCSMQVNNLVHEVPGLVGHLDWLLRWAQAAWPETQVGGR